MQREISSNLIESIDKVDQSTVFFATPDAGTYQNGLKSSFLRDVLLQYFGTVGISNVHCKPSKSGYAQILCEDLVQIESSTQ